MADLESPATDAELYRARGDEVAEARPYFTGDVFEASEVRNLGGEPRPTTVMIVQHPCAMRVNGVDLVPGLLVAEVAQHQYLKPRQWTGFTRVMPLPELLRDDDDPAQIHHAAYFNRAHIVRPEGLGARRASLSIRGVNLLLQRWVHHNSRVVVPTGEFLRVIGGVFEEAGPHRGMVRGTARPPPRGCHRGVHQLAKGTARGRHADPSEAAGR